MASQLSESVCVFFIFFISTDNEIITTVVVLLKKKLFKFLLKNIFILFKLLSSVIEQNNINKHLLLKTQHYIAIIHNEFIIYVCCLTEQRSEFFPPKLPFWALVRI